MSIRPGLIIEITLDRLSRVGHLKALIYDVEGTRLTISQTSPPILSSHTKKIHNYFLYLQEGKEDAAPWLFSRDFRFYKKLWAIFRNACPALIVDIKSEPEDMSLRRSFRVQPRYDSGLILTIRGKIYSIADISLSGLSFTQPLFHGSFRPSDLLDFELSIDRESYTVRGSVIRVSETVRSRLVSIVFKDMGTDIEKAWGQKSSWSRDKSWAAFCPDDDSEESKGLCLPHPPLNPLRRGRGRKNEKKQ